MSAQEGPPSASRQTRVLVLFPLPQEAEQELHGLQGSYTGQGSLVHSRVPFSHTLEDGGGFGDAEIQTGLNRRAV